MTRNRRDMLHQRVRGWEHCGGLGIRQLGHGIVCVLCRRRHRRQGSDGGSRSRIIGSNESPSSSMIPRRECFPKRCRTHTRSASSASQKATQPCRIAGTPSFPQMCNEGVRHGRRNAHRCLSAWRQPSL